MGRYPSTERSARDIILARIVGAGERRITQEEIKQNTGIHRSTIWRNMQKLMAEGRVKQYKTGKIVSYSLNNPKIMDFQLAGFLLNNEFVSKILTEKNLSVSSEYYKRKALDQDSPYISNIQKAIFEFSMRIGGYLTYVLINSINPEIIGKMSQVLPKNDLDVEFLNKLSEVWFRNAIEPNLSVWQWKFIEFLRFHNILEDPWNFDNRKKFHDIIKSTSRKDQLELILQGVKSKVQTKGVRHLLDAYSGIFPKYKKELDSITKNLLLQIDESKYFFEGLIESTEIQKKCKHEFKWHKGGALGKIKECIKCGFQVRRISGELK